MTRRAIVATVMTAMMLPVLLGLGLWQWQRMGWKEALIARLEASAAAPPLPFAEVREALRAEPDPAAQVGRRVALRGRFLHDREQRVWTVREGAQGWRIVTPFAIAADEDARCPPGPVALVIRGFVPDALADPARRAAGQTPGEVALVGRLRASEASAFVGSAGSRPGEWSVADLPAMAAALSLAGGCEGGSGQGDDATGGVLPLFVEAEDAAPPPAPQPDLAPIAPPNRHFEYALTWWSFALILLAIYALFMRAERRTAAKRA
jgi:surfeit locus 1 family protein